MKKFSPPDRFHIFILFCHPGQLHHHQKKGRRKRGRRKYDTEAFSHCRCFPSLLSEEKFLRAVAGARPSDTPPNPGIKSPFGSRFCHEIRLH